MMNGLSVLLGLLSIYLASSSRVIHNNIYSQADSKQDILRHSLGHEKWNDEKIANEFQVINFDNIRASTYLSSGPEAVAVPGTYMIFKPDQLTINNNDVVNISYYSSNPQSSDWIAAYSPANNTNFNTIVPVKMGWCDEDVRYTDKSSSKYGHGYLTFNFTNLRADITFVYYTGSTKSPIATNISDFTVTFANFNEPLRPRVLATGNPDVYKFMWSSYDSTVPVLKYGTVSGMYTTMSYASSKTIEEGEMCGGVAKSRGWRDLGLIHTANMTGMLSLSSKVIYYKFGDAATNDFSEEMTFHVAPKAGSQPAGRGTRAVLFDDLGRGSRDMTFTWNEYGRPSIRTAEMVGPEIAQGEVDVVYHGGDISYATGYISVWDFYGNMMAPVAGGALYLTTVGNHESDWVNSPSYWNTTDSGGECGVMSTVLYPMPEPATTNKPWWSYNVGLIHFVGMSTEHNFTTGSEQWNWLKNDLESVNRSVTPWIIFGGHRAMYLNSYYCCDSSTMYNPVDSCTAGCTPTSDIAVMNDLIKYIEPMLFANKVNFAFYGHNHVVQRQSAVYQNKVIQQSKKQMFGPVEYNYYDNPQATVHFVIGTGGARFTVNAINTSAPDHPKWNELFYYEYGYARVEAINSTYLSYEWVRNLDGQILDRAMIYQEDPNAPFCIHTSTSSSTNSGLSTSAVIAIAVLVPLAVIIAISVYTFRGKIFGSSSSGKAESYEVKGPFSSGGSEL